MAPIIEGFRNLLNAGGLLCAMLGAACAWVWLDLWATWKGRQ